MQIKHYISCHFLQLNNRVKIWRLEVFHKEFEILTAKCIKLTTRMSSPSLKKRSSFIVTSGTFIMCSPGTSALRGTESTGAAILQTVQERLFPVSPSKQWFARCFWKVHKQGINTMAVSQSCYLPHILSPMGVTPSHHHYDLHAFPEALLVIGEAPCSIHRCSKSLL